MVTTATMASQMRMRGLRKVKSLSIARTEEIDQCSLSTLRPNTNDGYMAMTKPMHPSNAVIAAARGESRAARIALQDLRSLTCSSRPHTRCYRRAKDRRPWGRDCRYWVADSCSSLW